MIFPKESSQIFAKRIIEWQQQFGRHTLPWQQTTDPYHVWLSEIMLQQTQVVTVIPYFIRFIQRFPTISALAEATQDSVLELWAGLGYYTRARNLHKAAQLIVEKHQGFFPDDQADREELPGIGRSTAGAIGVFSFNQQLPILDGNVKRVLCRYFAIEGDVYSKRIEDTLWSLAETLLPDENLTAYTQGLMDLGATVCTRTKPQCPSCPLNNTCQAWAKNQVELFPQKKKKTKPKTINLTVLIFEFKGRWWIQQRQDSIWKHLWAFPMVFQETPINQWFHENNIEAECVDQYPTIRHQLTHRTLVLTPERWQIKSSKNVDFFRQGEWLSIAEIQTKAIPVAMKKILDSLPQANSR